jgi:hypothetical protein
MRHKFDTPFYRWMETNGIQPTRLAQKAEMSRMTIHRLRKGNLGTPRTRKTVLSACSALSRRRLTELELFGIENIDV